MQLLLASSISVQTDVSRKLMGQREKNSLSIGLDVSEQAHHKSSFSLRLSPISLKDDLYTSQKLLLLCPSESLVEFF